MCDGYFTCDINQSWSMNFEKPLAVLFWMIVSFFAGMYCAYHPQQTLNWAGGAGDYIASLVNRECKPTPGFMCVPIPSPSPTVSPTPSTNPALRLAE
jgi:hypothetical protein